MLSLMHTKNSFGAYTFNRCAENRIMSEVLQGVTLKLESVWESEVQSDEAGGDAGVVREAWPEAFLCRLRQALEHYKTPYFSKQILYMCCMYLLLYYV
jgi:hypothetical protein